jgi:predicted transcriptional regulator
VTNAHRGRYLIIAHKLITINDAGADGAAISIMYKAFLFYAQLSEYLSFLVERGLVDEFPQQVKGGSGNEKFLYKITEKGRHLWQISQEVESLVSLD